MRSGFVFLPAAAIAVALLIAPAIAQDATPAVPPAQPPRPQIRLGTALSPDVAYARNIALIRAHLLTGDDLAAAKLWGAAVRHLGFPREEIYGVIRDSLAAYKTPPFDYQLMAAVNAAQAGNAKLYAAARQKIDAALAAADASLKVRQLDWSRFSMRVAVELLHSAPDEYDDAVSDSRIVRPLGYQTARGILTQVSSMLDVAVAGATGANAEAMADMRAKVGELRKAFAPVVAPKQLPIEPATLREAVSQIEAAAGKLT